MQTKTWPHYCKWMSDICIHNRQRQKTKQQLRYQYRPQNISVRIQLTGRFRDIEIKKWPRVEGSDSWFYCYYLSV